jgi:hypothetical protein
MKQFYFLIIIFVFLFTKGRSQTGGENTYQFLELTNSARIAALGGNQVALYDTTDLNLPFHNPALLKPQMHNYLLLNYVNYFSDIHFGYVSYAHSLGKGGTMALGMHYLNYGDFREATEFGELTGNWFTAAEYALNIIWANNYNRLSYGINIKPVFSAFETYRSFGLTADAGVSLLSKSGLTNVGLVFKNAGAQLTKYYENGVREPVPFDIQAGISRKLEHAPLIFSVTLQHLNHWNLNSSADNPENTDDLRTTWFQLDESFGKQLMRHVIVGAEIFPSDHFVIRAGYNYQRRQELKFEDKTSTVGLSLGFGLKIKRFRFDFATSRFHLAGSSNLFSMAINLNESL